MRDKTDVSENKISDRDSKAMSMAFNIDEAKGMARFLLKHEHQGPGDTIEAAAQRNQTKYGVPASILLRLWGREVNDMLLSNFAALAAAYVAVGDRVEKAYEHEKYLANNSKITRLADLVAGAKDEA